MDLKHTTKAELVAEIAALRKQLAEVEKERDALKGLAEKQRDLVDGWEKTCKEFRDLFLSVLSIPGGICSATSRVARRWDYLGAKK